MTLFFFYESNVKNKITKVYKGNCHTKKTFNSTNTPFRQQYVHHFIVRNTVFTVANSKRNLVFSIRTLLL